VVAEAQIQAIQVAVAPVEEDLAAIVLVAADHLTPVVAVEEALKALVALEDQELYY
jgi:hypothetical protein|tara:strand:- start:264 stop:431 length:168 start_codon:yes stop_codon:yes gene_type:complete